MDLRRVTPELRCFRELEVPDDQPFELPEPFLCNGPLTVPTTGFSPITKYPLTTPSAISTTVFMCEWSPVMPAGIETLTVFCSRGLTVPCLEQRHRVFREFPHHPEGDLFSSMYVLKSLSWGAGHGKIAREKIVEGRNVRRALNRGMTAERHDPSARSSHVSQQRLDDRGRTYVLDAGRVLCPSHCVAEGGGPLAS